MNINYKKTIKALHIFIYITMLIIIIAANNFGVFLFIDNLRPFYYSEYYNFFIHHTPLMYIEFFSINISLELFIFFIIYGYYLDNKRFLPHYLHSFIISLAAAGFIPTFICIATLWEYFSFEIRDFAVIAILLHSWRYRVIIFTILFIPILAVLLLKIRDKHKAKKFISKTTVE